MSPNLLPKTPQFTKNERNPCEFLSFFGATDRGRTGTNFRSRDFKSLASAYSTTVAWFYSVFLHNRGFIRLFFTARDFKSLASASSTTVAYFIVFPYDYFNK